MRARPDVDEHQAPEVDDGQPVAEHGPLGRLRQEVVHQPQEGRREEEGDGVVAVPPLHERVLHARKQRVALEQADRQHEVVDDVQDSDGDDRRDVKPDRDVEVLLTSTREGQKEVGGEDDPDDDDEDVDRPFEFGVLLRLRVAERQGDRRQRDDQLPAPEVDRTQGVVHAHLQEALRRIVDAGEDRVADEREDDRVCVQRPQPTEVEVRPDVELDKGELQRQPDADEHADGTPEDRRKDEATDRAVIVGDRDGINAHGGGPSRVQRRQQKRNQKQKGQRRQRRRRRLQGAAAKDDRRVGGRVGAMQRRTGPGRTQTAAR